MPEIDISKQVMQQAELDFHNAWTLYRTRPSKEAFGHVMQAFAACGLHAAVRQKGLSIALFHHAREKYKIGVSGISRALLWFSIYPVRRAMQKAPESWNDYHIARWMLDGNGLHLAALHHIVRHAHSPERVTSSGEWAIKSMRETEPGFAAAMDQIEATCKDCQARIDPEGLGRVPGDYSHALKTALPPFQD